MSFGIPRALNAVTLIIALLITDTIIPTQFRVLKVMQDLSLNRTLQAAQSSKDELWHPSWVEATGERTIPNAFEPAPRSSPKKVIIGFRV